LTPILIAATTAGCEPKLDTSRQPVDTGSFGTTVFTISCQRIAFERDLLDGNATVDVRGDRLRSVCRNGDAPGADAPPAIVAMTSQRTPLIAALDVMFPDGYLDELQTYVTSKGFLEMYDDGTMEKSLSSLQDVLELFSTDPGLAPALANLDRRPGYRPLLPALGLVRAVAAYDDLSDLTKQLTSAIAEGGPAHGEFVNFQLALSKELQDATDLQDHADDDDRSLRLATNLLLTESPLLGNGVVRPLVLRGKDGLAIIENDGNAVPAPFADVNGDHIADTDTDGNYVDAAGLPITPPAPFFSVYSAPDTAVARDDQKRALKSVGGPTLYRYVDLDKTVLGALVRDVPALMDPAKGTALDFLRGSSALLGTRVIGAEHVYSDGSKITYRGYDDSKSPLLDMAYGVMTLLADKNLPNTLSFVKALLTDHEPEAARLLESIWQIAEMGDAFPDAKLVDKSAMFDDLMPILVGDPSKPITDRAHFGILNDPNTFQGRTLAEDLLVGMQNPKVRDLGDRFRDFMKYKDRFDFSQSAPYDVVGGFTTLVDRNAADSAYNRSVFERLLHLIHDSAGVEMCNKQDAKVKQLGITLATYNKCDLLRVPDLAKIYVQSIAYARNADGSFKTDGGNTGNHFMPAAQLTFTFNNALIELVATDDFIEDQATVNGFRRHPTPGALNRILFMYMGDAAQRPVGALQAPQFLADTMAEAVDVDGDRFIDQHTGSLPVWEKNGFYDDMQPLVQAFVDHGREDLFVRALVVMHNHWPSKESTDTQDTNPSGHGFSKQSNAVSFEPMIVKVLSEGDFWHALTEGAATLNNITVPAVGGGTQKGFTVLANAGKGIFEPQDGLTDRHGNLTTKTEDGVTVSKLSPWYILADAYKEKREAVAGSASEGAAWEQSTSDMIDVFLRGEKVGSSNSYRFRNPRVRGVSLALVDFLKARIAAHAGTDAELKTWSRKELPDRLHEILTGPVFAGAADFVLSLVATPEARAALEKLNAYLCSEAGAPEAFVTALTGAGDLVQLLLDDKNLVPIIHVVGKILHPDFGRDKHPDFSLMDAQLDFLRKARDADETNALAKLLGYSFTELEGQTRTAVGQVVDSIADVQRVDPIGDEGKPMSAEDYVSSFHAVADFLGEQKRGFLRFVKIVKERNVRD
jgi:hypothetical protein